MGRTPDYFRALAAIFGGDEAVLRDWSGWLAARSIQETSFDADRVRARKELLTPGLPLAMPPVESFYRGSGAGRSGARCYLGDSALHVSHVARECGVEIPERFAAAPDHLSVILEMTAIILEGSGPREARAFASGHGSWLGPYRRALSARAGELDGSKRARSVREEIGLLVEGASRAEAALSFSAA